MNKRYPTFNWFLDLGDLGEHDCKVTYDAYKAKRPDVDDFDSMTIVKVEVVLRGFVINVVDMLSDSRLDDVIAEAWEDYKDNLESDA